MMKSNQYLTYKDLIYMEKLLKKPQATFSTSGKLTELDKLAIEVIHDVERHPHRQIYNLRMFNDNKDKINSTDSKVTQSPVLKVNC